jgi:dihydrofolate reductase
MMRVSLIAALDTQRAIGVDNRLPWHLPDDLRRFKALTLGKPLLMGRLTAESLGRALPGRLNLVLTHSGRVPFDGMRAVATVRDAMAIANDAGAEEVAVIGGGGVFAACLPRATDLRLTHVHVALPRADAYFPPYQAAQWREVSREHHATDARHAHAFDFVDYVRA